MPSNEAPCVELGSVPEDQNIITSPSPSEVSTPSSPEPHHVRVEPTPLFRALAMTPPEPDQPPGQDELERRLPGYRRIVIPRELTLIELLKQSSGVTTDEEVLQIREVKLRVIAEKVGLRRLHVLAPRLKSLTLDGSALSSLRDLGIGLVHLKMLSVNRCGLTCLDGVWGLGALRELHAAGNRLRDLQPLAALQKLHTLDMAGNPITESSRIWTLGVCSSLKRLTLRGTPASDAPDYRARVASALPLLVNLDDIPMHVVDDELEDEIVVDIKDSESESGGEESVPEAKKVLPSSEPIPAPSTSYTYQHVGPDGDQDSITVELLPPAPRPRIRPFTTECAGDRPKYRLPPRPRTAAARPVQMPTKLTILNTLMDEDWRCSGSKLTSHGDLCGNIARALRRPASASHLTSQSTSPETGTHALHETIADASRSLAAEIPRAPHLEDWEKFRTETGIDIQLDFTERTVGDPFKAIERLEQIERETSERLNNPTELFVGSTSLSTISEDLWKDIQDMAPNANPNGDTDLPIHNIITSVCSSPFSANEGDVA